MNKKRESNLFKPIKDSNVFKKKGCKLLKSLSPLPSHSLHSPFGRIEADELMKTKIKI